MQDLDHGDVTGRKLCSELSHLQNSTVGEESNRVRESTNSEDTYAVAVMRNSAVVSLVRRKMSASCALFFRYKIRCTDAARRDESPHIRGECFS